MRRHHLHLLIGALMLGLGSGVTLWLQPAGSSHQGPITPADRKSAPAPGSVGALDYRLPERAGQQPAADARTATGRNDGASPPSARTGRLHGQLTTEGELPLGLTVELHGPRGVHAECQASPGGSFSFADVPPGHWILRVEHGERLQGETRFELAVGEDRRCDVELRSPVELSGRVLRARDRQPVAGATVTLTTFGSRGARHRRTTSDVGGRFRFSVFTAAATVLQATADGYAHSAGQQLAVGSTAGQPLELLLEEAATLRGQILDLAGRPVAGAAITVQSLELPAPPRTTSGPDGQFVLGNLEPDVEVELVVRHQVLAPARWQGRTPQSGQVASGLELRLEPLPE